MADLFDRIVTNPDDEKTISGHYLPGMIASYHFGDTPQSIKTFFEMGIDAAADLDVITNHFDTLSAIQKLEFLIRIETANTRIELGIITTKSQYVTFLGI